MQPNSYDFQVGLKYQLYNSIFLTLHFATIKNTSIELPVFRAYINKELEKGLDPRSIIQNYFEEHKNVFTIEEYHSLLFRIIQYVERQVVIIDALEESSFGLLNDLNGEGSLHHLIERVKTDNRTLELQQALNDFRVKIVLTAHPTQFYPGSVLGIINDLSHSIKAGELPEIRDLLEQLGQTPFFKKDKPTPYNEAVSLGWYLESVFYDTLPGIVNKVKSFAKDINFENYRLLEVGFWPGGDRDGNPYVTVDTTIKVAKRLKFLLLKSYYKDVRALKRRLTFRGTFEKIESIEETLRITLFESEKSLNFDLDHFKTELESIRTLLIETYESFFLDKVDELLLKIKIFGHHFASIDIRQDSRVISKAIELCLPNLPLNKITSEAYFDLSFVKPSDQIIEPVIEDVYEIFQAIKTIQKANGEVACERFIISNCQAAKSVLQVFALAKNLGMGDQPNLDIVPLFETIDDLERSPKEMSQLYKLPTYVEHLKRRGGRQYIMLGFSDGTKDGGYFAANWNIYKAKEHLTSLSRKYGIEVVFFDGRGGPPARGGGNVRKYYAAQGSIIENKEVQLTIQGQTVSSRFSSMETATHYLENLLTAGMESRLYGESGGTNKEEDQLMQEIAADSLEAYINLKSRNDFIAFLEHRSPLKYFGLTNVGSRPSKRGSGSQLTLEDLRAIPFVASWSAMKLNVPGYYGLGIALDKAVKKHGFEIILALYQNNHFFESLISNSMQSLSKTRMELTRYFQQDSRYCDLWNHINEENLLTKKMISELIKSKDWNDALGTKHSIELREEIVLPLLVIQQYALMELEMDKANQQVYEKLIIRTLYGIINAARNSA